MDSIPEPVVRFLEQLAEMRLPPEADARIQDLMEVAQLVAFRSAKGRRAVTANEPLRQ